MWLKWSFSHVKKESSYTKVVLNKAGLSSEPICLSMIVEALLRSISKPKADYTRSILRNKWRLEFCSFYPASKNHELLGYSHIFNSTNDIASSCLFKKLLPLESFSIRILFRSCDLIVSSRSHQARSAVWTIIIQWRRWMREPIALFDQTIHAVPALDSAYFFNRSALGEVSRR